ncbi:MAG: NAD-dependent epimerase/dehydratase family protein [Bacteroidota bacterium]
MILLTGATGFLGQYLLEELLTQGHDLRVLVRNPDNRDLPWKNLVEIAEGDVRDVLAVQQAVKGVSHVIHNAAVVSYWKGRRAEMMAVNVEGTANVVDMCLEEGVGKLVHMSSIAAMGDADPDGGPVTEASKYTNRPGLSWYSKSKHGAELEVHRGVQEGLDAVMLNPGVILGKGDWNRGTPKMFRMINAGLNYYNQRVTGFVGAADVARATEIMLHRATQSGERFLMVSENLDQQKLFTMVAESLGKQPPSKQFPAALTPVVGLLSEWISRMKGEEPILTRESLRNINGKVYYQADKIREQGFKFTPIKKVIAQTAEAFKKEIMESA